MKVWLKYLIAVVVGIILSFAFPAGSVQANAALNFIVELIIRFGRFTLLPMLFFSISTAFFNLREEKLMFKTSLWIFATLVGSTVLLTLLGMTSCLVRLPIIPITFEKASEIPSLNLSNLLTKLFPYSGFESLLEGAYLLPCFIIAGLAGAGAASDKTASKAAVSLFDSLSNVCYIVMSFFTEILTVGIIALMTKWTLNFIFVLKAGVFNYLILTLTINLLLIAFVIYPLILKFLCHDPHPYKVLYASICSFITALISGDTNLTLVLNMRHGKDSLGIRRRTNSVAFTLFSIFGRGGSALVQAICFVVIFRSYSSLGISVTDTLWIAGVSFILSFVLGQIPSGGPFVAITIMCLMYGRGFEDGYLLLKDAAPIICSFAAAIDALTAMTGSYIIAVKTKMITHQDIKKFI